MDIKSFPIVLKPDTFVGQPDDGKMKEIHIKQISNKQNNILLLLSQQI
jgi:hypothetical protein